jgi:catechol 2,3-dioxygenase-like lactoylglutathione lyase family enzyme
MFNNHSVILPSHLRPRREPTWRVGLIALAVLLLSAALSVAAPAPEAPEKPLATAVVRVGITVADMDRSVAFYRDVLEFEKVSDVEVAGKGVEQRTGVFGARCRIVRLRLGDEEIELTEYLAAASRGREVPRDSRSNDRWFQHVAIIVSDMDAAYSRLRRHKVRHASTGPQRLPDWNRSAGGIKAFYFHDPDDHVLEVLQFPPGKGDNKWHEKAKGVNGQPPPLFLGIDHTAIVVADTDKSVTFYRGLLGLKVVAESENWGDEQEHLNNVFGARLRITTLRAAEGPGVELLEYLTPRTGRDYPRGSQANDIWHWHTSVATPDIAGALRKVREDRRTLISAGAAHDFLVRDPDGHAVQVVASQRIASP